MIRSTNCLWLKTIINLFPEIERVWQVTSDDMSNFFTASAITTGWRHSDYSGKQKQSSAQLPYRISITYFWWSASNFPHTKSMWLHNYIVFWKYDSTGICIKIRTHLPIKRLWSLIILFWLLNSTYIFYVFYLIVGIHLLLFK